MSKRARGSEGSKVDAPIRAEEALDSSAYPLAVFRILFGCILTRFFWDLYSSSWVALQFDLSQITLYYEWIPWLRASSDSLNLALVILIASSICFTIGLLYRINCILLLAFYSYLYLADPSWYAFGPRSSRPLEPLTLTQQLDFDSLFTDYCRASSSRYLILVLILLFTLVNAHKVGSIDALFFTWLGVADMKVPDLHLNAFKIIFTLVPLYSGVAKWMSEDWMERAEPLSTLLLFGSVSHSYPAWAFLSGPSFGFSPSALVDLGFLVSYAIVSVEVVGTVALWHHWTRPLGLLSTALLALLHSSIAQGLYPYITICSLCLWVSPERSRSILNAMGLVPNSARQNLASKASSQEVINDKNDASGKNISKSKKTAPSHVSGPLAALNRPFAILSLVLLYAFLAQQLITPAIPYFGAHHPTWSVPANSISWRMMTQTQTTLVSWYASKLPNPKSSLPNPGQSYLVSHLSEAYSSKRVSDDTWSAVLNSPSMLMQWSSRFVLRTIQDAGLQPKHLHVNAYRSVNGRPFQIWFKPSRSDAVTHRCSPWLGCDDLLEPRIEEFNTLDWMYEQQLFMDEWIQKGHETVVFAQRKGSTFDAAFQQFSEKIQFVLLSGSVALDVQDRDEMSQPAIGELVLIPWEAYHSIKTISKEPAAWAYVWPWPRNMTLGDALGM